MSVVVGEPNEGETMIQILVRCNGQVDRAESDTPEGAILAARTMFDETYGANAGAFNPVVTFIGPDGFTTTLKAGRKP
jgi:hypothetical protein